MRMPIDRNLISHLNTAVQTAIDSFFGFTGKSLEHKNNIMIAFIDNKGDLNINPAAITQAPVELKVDQ